MPKFVLHYFDARGRGEPARLLFAIAGIPFQDKRISREEWPNLKPKIPGGTLPYLEVDGVGITQSMVIYRHLARLFEIPGGTLPYLEVDGVGITQSMVIYRHLARLFGLDGDTVLDKAHVEEITEYVMEMMLKYMKELAFPPKDDEEKLKQLKEDFMTKLHTCCGQITRILETNKSTDGWAVGKKLTFADIILFEAFDHVLSLMPEVLDKYPRIQKCRTKVRSLRKLQEYLSKRKVTAF